MHPALRPVSRTDREIWFRRMENGLYFRPRFSIRTGLCKVPDPPEIHYSPLTAADEKIPLSMVHVNNKPQYLVF